MELIIKSETDVFDKPTKGTKFTHGPTPDLIVKLLRAGKMNETMLEQLMPRI